MCKHNNVTVLSLALRIAVILSHKPNGPILDRRYELTLLYRPFSRRPTFDMIFLTIVNGSSIVKATCFNGGMSIKLLVVG